MKCRTHTSLILFLTLSACRAGSVDINEDEVQVVDDGSDLEDSSDSVGDSDEDEEDEEDERR